MFVNICKHYISWGKHTWYVINSQYVIQTMYVFSKLLYLLVIIDCTEGQEETKNLTDAFYKKSGWNVIRILLAKH